MRFYVCEYQMVSGVKLLVSYECCFLKSISKDAGFIMLNVMLIKLIAQDVDIFNVQFHTKPPIIKM